MEVLLDPKNIKDYLIFLKIKELPMWSIVGRKAWYPDKYHKMVTGDDLEIKQDAAVLSDHLFDYQRSIVQMAWEKKKFAIFADCGLGKTLMYVEFMKNAVAGGVGALMVAPLMVVGQTIEECSKFYPDLQVEKVASADLQDWVKTSNGKIGITNYESFSGDSIDKGQLDCLVLDESSMLKSHYGKWGTRLIELGKGMTYKLCGTGTPAPNDRIEYANHAVFLDAFPTVNAFLATYFVNKGQTQERWILKPHALEPFYRQLSDWCIFMSSPATYGWCDNIDSIPPINVTIHQVDSTNEQRSVFQEKTGQLFATEAGGIATRGMLGQIAKGSYKGTSIDTNKPDYIKQLIDSWPSESTIIWCVYNSEQEMMEKTFPEAVSIKGSTPLEERLKGIAEFKSGERSVLISKPKVLGFGLNLQVATRHVFSGLQDSYESYYQAVKRSNRIGSTLPLNVHIPITEYEEPMVANVLSKADRVQADTDIQERLFSKWKIQTN